MKLSKPKQFLIVLAAFLVLGIPFKVMVLVDGFTEVRPVNAVPPIAGLICGPIGALACGLGNLIADFFGSFNATSILGFFGNAAGAFLPYRLWHIYSDEAPNLHKNKNILKYTLICLSAALTVSWLLGFGLMYFFGSWVEQVYSYVFLNNLGFSVGLGMPVFIILSSDDINIVCAEKPKKYLVLRNEKLRKIVPIVFTAILVVIMVLVLILRISPVGNVPMMILSALALLGLLAILI